MFQTKVQTRLSMTVNMKHLSLVIAAVILCRANVVISERLCDASELEQCAQYESCVTEPLPILNPATQHLNGTCHCLQNYQRSHNGECVRIANLEPNFIPLHGHPASASTVAAGVLVPITLIAVAGALIYFGRRYQWLAKLRQPAVRQYDTVLIGAQMDGDDDPPIL